MKEYLLVDGYNVLFNWPETGKSADLDHARARLVLLLVNYAGLTGQEVIVVFDAHRVPGGIAHSEKVAGVEVIFTAEGETADAVIERLCGRLAKEGTVRVVTADWAEQRIAFGQGAYRMPPREFWAMLREIDSKKLLSSGEKPADGYLENRLDEEVRRALEALRRR
ncbi:NYN domain-containing protein [Desulforudis sp. 1088]|uniref:NYN domain-containing protein n=2 Tax=Candidatus Desulforudis TaxID=471826 RepID=UPI00348B57E0